MTKCKDEAKAWGKLFGPNGGQQKTTPYGQRGYDRLEPNARNVCHEGKPSRLNGRRRGQGAGAVALIALSTGYGLSAEHSQTIEALDMPQASAVTMADTAHLGGDILCLADGTETNTSPSENMATTILVPSNTIALNGLSVAL
ncbi:MAG: hypothetical protein ACQR33_06675 [Candidatus Saccharibacteria bacterium]